MPGATSPEVKALCGTETFGSAAIEAVQIVSRTEAISQGERCHRRWASYVEHTRRPGFAFERRFQCTLQRRFLQHWMPAENLGGIDAAVFPNANLNLHIPHDSSLPRQRRVDRRIHIVQDDFEPRRLRRGSLGGGNFYMHRRPDAGSDQQEQPKSAYPSHSTSAFLRIFRASPVSATRSNRPRGIHFPAVRDRTAFCHTRTV